MKHCGTLGCFRNCSNQGSSTLQQIVANNPPSLVKMVNSSAFFLLGVLGLITFPANARSIDCSNRVVSNTIDEIKGITYSISLNDGEASYYFSGDASTYHWLECSDGSAEFSARNLTAPDKTGERIEVYLLFNGAVPVYAEDSDLAALKPALEEFSQIEYTKISGVIHSGLHGVFNIEASENIFRLEKGNFQQNAATEFFGNFNSSGGD